MMREESDYQPGGRPLTGRTVLLILLGFFGVILGVNFYMATYAAKTFSGVDADDAYDSGLAYNKEIAAAKAQALLGWTVELNRVNGAGVTQITVNVKDKDGKPVGGLDAAIDFYLPGDAEIRPPASPRPPSPKASIPARPHCAPGRWEVQVSLNRERPAPCSVRAIPSSSSKMAVSPDYSHFVKTDAEGRSRIDLAIDGITCAACLGDIETAMKRLPGVVNARLNLTSHRLAVTFDAARIQAGGLTSALEIHRLSRLSL